MFLFFLILDLSNDLCGIDCLNIEVYKEYTVVFVHNLIVLGLNLDVLWNIWMLNWNFCFGYYEIRDINLCSTKPYALILYRVSVNV